MIFAPKREPSERLGGDLVLLLQVTTGVAKGCERSGA